MSPRGKLPYEFKPGEALTAAGLNNVQSQILDEVDANRAAAEQTGTQLDQKIAAVAQKAAADLAAAVAGTNQRIDGVQTTLDGKFTTMGAALDKKFTDQLAAVNQKVGDTAAALDKKFTDQNAAQDKKLSDTFTAFDRKFTDQGAALDKKFGDQTAALDQKIASSQGQIGQAQTRIGTIENWMGQTDTVLTRLLRMMSPVAATRVMDQRDGSKALSQEFTTSGGTVFLFISAAARRDGGTMAIDILVDGRKVDGYLAFNNESNSHKTFVQLPTVVPNLAPGKHTVQLKPVAPTSVDLNDFFDVSVLELPDATVTGRMGMSGPFPKEATVETRGGFVVAFFHGSGFRNPGGGQIGMDFQVDGTVYGATRGFTNEQASHKAFVPAAVVIPNLPAGRHQVRMVPHGGTITDGNDYAAFLLVEFPPLVQARALSLLKQQPGPLPGVPPFTTYGGKVMLIVNGSGWNNAEKQIGMDITIDGVVRGTCRRYTNEGGSHKAFVTAHLVLDLPAGDHKLQLTAFNNTSTDFNDFFDILLLELPS